MIAARGLRNSMKVQFRAKPKPFLDPSRRDWQFDAFAWLLRNCGGYPKFLETTLVLPSEEHFPDRKEKVLSLVRETRGGNLSDPRFGTRMRGVGRYAENLTKLFEVARRQAGIPATSPPLSISAFRKPQTAQMTLFD